jgi:serine/threonine-protein kinase
MADKLRVQRLLDEILESERSPEEVCGDCPELLPEVRRRLYQMRLVEAELDALFPTSGTDSKAGVAASLDVGGDLPKIPGYELQTVLGYGGMGVVYKARHLRLNRIVALKMLRAGAHAAPHELARFRREAEAVAGLRHPNIVQVYDVGDHEARPYFTMEFIEGGSLRQKLASTPQPARESAALAATLSQAVEAAHQGGIVHRDLKPANILLTADGTAKIADFGLARHFDTDAAVTSSGARLGTPSYMAPEQAIGKAHTIGPSADIYSLGAILYELLTGRPPFRGETAVETELQVIHEEPVPPSRLNSKVPRDLETICLKCLHKDPERRYTTAAALAEDLHRFQRSEPIAARPAGLLERTAKWVRRHPTQSALLAAGLLLVVMAVSASLWLVVQQAHERDALKADLNELARLQASARWTEARGALERAEARFGGGAPRDVRQRLGQARRDLDMVIRLDSIRLNRVTRGELVFYQAQADRDYQRALREAGLGNVLENPARAAAVVKDSAVRAALVAALDDWAVCCNDKGRRDWLLEVARQADIDPQGWRRRFVVPAAWDDPAALAELARIVPADQSVSLLLALGERLRATGPDATAFLKRVQKEHPADFWANLILGNATLQLAPQEAAGYYRAALASRPAAAVGYVGVGDALRLQNWLDEAIDYYKKAIQVDPGYARAYSNLGLALLTHGRVDQAIDYCRKALELDPDYAWAHYNFGNALRATGRLDEAYDHYRHVLRVDPKNPEVHNCLASVLLPQGRGQVAQVEWRKALDANPPEFAAWQGYAESCLFLGQQQEYRRTRRALLDRFGTTGEPHVAEPVGRACLLLPSEGDDLQRATALADRAVAAKASTPEWIYRYFLFAKGLAEYRQGRLESAVSLMEGEAAKVMGPCPRLVLAMAEHGQGQTTLARESLALAVIAFDWSAAQADHRDVLVCHILRREAEAMILLNLPAFLAGEYQPHDNDERLALLGACQFQGLYRAAAGLYADAFTADGGLADKLAAECSFRAARGDEQPIGRVEELSTVCRYPAARCAALVARGLGKDGAGLGDAERTRWLRQARQWLQADLALWSKTLDGPSRSARDLARKMLTRWQVDPDLAGLREPRELDQLAAADRNECLTLWNEVASVLTRARRVE